MTLSEELRNEAMDRVERNASEAWKILMATLVKQVATTKQHFTSDDVFAKYDELVDPPKTHEPRAFGPVMMRAARDGLCRKTPNFDTTVRPSMHAQPIRIWESLVYAQQ